MNVGLIVAGGSGKRMGCLIPKQFIEVSGKPILWYTLDKFEKAESINKIVLTLPSEYVHLCEKWRNKFSKLHDIIPGGAERVNSVRNGLEYCNNEDIVAIHDGVRPFIDINIINKGFSFYKQNIADGIIVGVKEKNTLKKVIDDYVVETVDRTDIWEIQTPQFFKAGVLKKLIDKLISLETDLSTFTDDSSILEAFSKKIYVIEGSSKNIKITTPEDIDYMKYLLDRSLA